MTMNISPADMVLFATVVREGGFTRAAAHLGLSKQTVSERIAKLEERLGVRLLERTTRRFRVTDAGTTYAERCAAIAAQIDEANGEVQQHHGAPSGLLRVSAPVLYGRRFLTPVIADYLARYRGTRVELVLANRRVDLIEEGIDVAIRIGALRDSTLTARKLGEGYVHYVASPAYLAVHGAPTARTLARAQCISVQPFETWTVDGVQTKIEAALVTSDLEIACDAAIAGVGVARLPSLVCQEAVQKGLLRVLFGPRSAVASPVYAVYPSRAYLPVKVRVFVESLATRVEPMLPLSNAR